MNECPFETRGDILDALCDCDGEECEAGGICERDGCERPCQPNETIVRSECQCGTTVKPGWCQTEEYCKFVADEFECIKKCWNPLDFDSSSEFCNCNGVLCKSATHACYEHPGEENNVGKMCVPRCHDGAIVSENATCICADRNLAQNMLCHPENTCFQGECLCREGGIGPCKSDNGPICAEYEIYSGGICTTILESCNNNIMDRFPSIADPCQCGNDACAPSPFMACMHDGNQKVCVPACPQGNYFSSDPAGSEIITWHTTQCACRNPENGEAVLLENGEFCSTSGNVFPICSNDVLLGGQCMCSDMLCSAGSFCHNSRCSVQCDYMSGEGCYCGDMQLLEPGDDVLPGLCSNSKSVDHKHFRYCSGNECVEMCDRGLQQAGQTCFCERDKLCDEGMYCSGGWPGLDAKCVSPCTNTGVQEERCLCSTWHSFPESVCEPGDYCLEPTYASVSLPNKAVRCYRPCAEDLFGEACSCAGFICPRGYYCLDNWCTQCNYIDIHCTRCALDVCFEMLFEPIVAKNCPSGFGYEEGRCRRCPHGQRQRKGVCNSILHWWEILLIVLSGVVLAALSGVALVRWLEGTKRNAKKDE